MQHLEGSGTPVLYIGRTVLKGQTTTGFCPCTGLDQKYKNPWRPIAWASKFHTVASNIFRFSELN